MNDERLKRLKGKYVFYFNPTQTSKISTPVDYDKLCVFNLEEPHNFPTKREYG